jgi:hypothetical protein
MHKGNISIGKVTSNVEPYTFINIEIADDNGLQIVDCNIPMEQYGHLIAGTHGINCEFHISNVDKIGKTRELKTIVVEYDQNDNKDQMLIKAQEYEVDGWSINYKGDIGNHHRMSYDHTANKKLNRLTYVRFV